MTVTTSKKTSIYLFVVLLAMFASAVRSFAVRSSSLSGLCARRLATPPTTIRYLSSNPPDTTVVQTCTDKIKTALETESVKVTGAYDDPNGSHISIQVVSDLFVGKRAMQRQQLVYKAIWEEMQGPVHAVDEMICKTPEEEA